MEFTVTIKFKHKEVFDEFSDILIKDDEMVENVKTTINSLSCEINKTKKELDDEE